MKFYGEEINDGEEKKKNKKKCFKTSVRLSCR